MPYSKPSLSDYSFVYEEDLSGYGPKEHQRVISKLTTRLGMLNYLKGSIALEPFPETMLDEAKASPVADLLLYDNETAESPIIIEISNQEGLKRDFKKVMQLIDDGYYGIREGFVYNYKTLEWHQYRQDGGWQQSDRSYSAILQVDFNEFL